MFCASIYSPPLIYFDFEINCTRVSINRQYVSSIIISISIYFYLFQNEISMETVVTGNTNNGGVSNDQSIIYKQ